MSLRSRTRLSPDARKAQLLAHAMTAYADIGIERAGHGDVAKLAGVSTATVFNYFSTRESLTDAVLAEIEEKVIELFASVPATIGTSSQQVLVLANAYEKMTELYPDMSKVFLAWSVSFASDLRDKHLAFEDKVLTEITRRLRDKADRTDARIILAAANMLAAMKLDEKDPDVIKRFITRIAEMVD